jgi:alkanesulfonate monooxygenase SsuD/methylene tetrahydromethanopterin reductase-like flavin-dependent oxidoreductase (luciferase family)
LKYGITLPNFGICGDPRRAADLARLTEDSGWDGFFLWDHVLWTEPRHFEVADPYVTLAACAGATSRVLIGPAVTPLPRRRPWQVARQVATLDHLSGGRVVLGVGIGGDWFGDYTGFGEPDDRIAHGEMLDEALDIVTGLWSGEPFSYEGKHYTIRDVTFLPPPVQRPRVPIWVAGTWPNKKPLRRAARWDGVLPLPKDDFSELSPDEIREIAAYIAEHRTSAEPFDIVIAGRTTGDLAKERERLTAIAEAGATWWYEHFGIEDTVEAVSERIAQGPPRI